MRQPTVYILSIGDELLFGHTVDTNAAWLAEQSTLAGWRILGQRTVGDVTPDIVDAFLEASAKADFVIATGGLGPTPDDRTRSALARAMGAELREDPEAIREIEERFRSFGRPMAAVNRVQALIPAGAERIVNPHGTAPGIRGTLGTARVFCMPGVPREMREMFRDAILPLMKGAEGATSECMRRLHLCGRGEGEIGAALKDLMGEKSNPEVGTTVAESVVNVRIYAKGGTMAEAEALTGEAEAKIRSLLGQDIFGADGETLAGCVVNLLKERHARLVVAESCTGGMLSSMLVDVPGVSEVFLEGLVTYANESKARRLGVPEATLAAHGAVSAETARAMAENPLRYGDREGPLFSLATTGVAGPDGGTPEKPAGTVWIACSRLNADGTGATRTMLFKTAADRRGVRLRAANAALDLLRRGILGHPGAYNPVETLWKKGE